MQSDGLKHSIAVGGLRGNALYHIPMFYNFALFDAENIDNGLTTILCILSGMYMEHHQITFGYDTLDGVFCIWMFFKVLGEVVYKRCFAVCNIGIMLNVLYTNIAVRIGLNLMLAKNALIKVHHNFFILFGQGRGRMVTRRC